MIDTQFVNEAGLQIVIQKFEVFSTKKPIKIAELYNSVNKNLVNTNFVMGNSIYMKNGNHIH